MTKMLKEYAGFEYQRQTDTDGKPKLSKYGNILVRGIIQRANALNQNKLLGDLLSSLRGGGPG